MERRGLWDRYWGMDAINQWFREREFVADVMSNTTKYLRPGNRVLDLGCGDGQYMAHLRQYGVKPVGLDLSLESLGCIKSFPCILGSSDEIPFKSKKFDVVLAVLLFEHVKCVVPVLEEICRVLKSGGILVSVIPNAHSPSVLIYWELVMPLLKKFRRELEIPFKLVDKTYFKKEAGKLDFGLVEEKYLPASHLMTPRLLRHLFRHTSNLFREELFLVFRRKQ